MRWVRTFLALVVLEDLHSTESSGTTNELMAEAALVGGVVVLDVLVSLLIVAYDVVRKVS
jgi:hypothetical protein